jgi:hypothetical protein
MAENIQRSRGRSSNYKFDRGGMPAEMGPYIGRVVNNVDTTRSGRLQVYINEFGATDASGKPDLTNQQLWRTVSYCPPFYGSTAQAGTSSGSGTYPGNSNSYGMWFTPPDLGTEVLCFFVGGDPGMGYYVGCIPVPGINHMIPAIGSSAKYVTAGVGQNSYLAGAPLLPVTEINQLNVGVSENPKFYDQPKPIQSVVAGTFLQQGLINDPVRGPIRSNSQRESPSSVYGISTPGKPIYQGGLKPETIKAQLEQSQVNPQDIVVVGRQGGHTLVMDDGDLSGTDTLIRIRTAKGHQITMSDDGNCFYICHANGQSWVELGQNGSVDVYSTNSVNVRTQGTLNLHADRDINMYAGGNIKMKAKGQLKLEGDQSITMFSDQAITLYGKTKIGVRSDGQLALQGKSSSWNGGGSLNLKASVINLNGAAAAPVAAVTTMTGYNLADTTFVTGSGWISQPGTLPTIVTRAPTHEPFAGHNGGVNVTTDLNDQSTAAASTTAAATAAGNIKSLATTAYVRTNSAPVQNPIQFSNYVSEPRSVLTVPAQ